jgi:methionyl-tRNA formyltransferase
VQLYDTAKRVGDAAGAPGTIVAIGTHGLTIAAHGGQIEVRRVRFDDGAKIRAEEFAQQVGLQLGSRLGT